MSYLTLDRDTPMNQVVISFWFRIPTETADAVRAKTPGSFWDYRVMLGVVPLIVWGTNLTTTVTEAEYYDSGDDYPGVAGTPPAPIMLWRISGSHIAPVSPSFIGMRVGGESWPSDPPTLDIHIQTNDHASASGLLMLETGWHPEPPDNFPDGEYDVVFDYEDFSWTVTEEPDYLGNSDANSSSTGSGQPEVVLDQWHHVVISWDLLPNSTSGLASKMWCAVDDVNKDGYELPAMCDPGLGMDPNDHMSWVPYTYLGDAGSASITFTDIPSNPLSIPGPPSVDYSESEGSTASRNPIEAIELAELQIFAGVTLDTSVEGNRRAFIDADGTPIDPTPTLDDPSDPTSPKHSPAERLLGQPPDILLHGSGNWIAGKNTGPMIDNPDYDPGQPTSADNPLQIPDPAKQFTPTGKIVAYTPDPSLYGPQSPDPPPAVRLERSIRVPA